MGTDLTNSGCACFDECMDIYSCRTLIIQLAQFFLSFNEISYPISKRLTLNTFKKGRELEMSMEIDKAGKKDRVSQVDHAMAGKPFFYFVSCADSQNCPLSDRYCSILDYWGPGFTGDQF